MNKRSNYLVILVYCFSFSIIMSTFVSSQTQQTALLAIQQAEDKLYETISMLEEASEKKLDIRDLVINTDEARQLIATAKTKYNEANYTEAYNSANAAIDKLENVEEELELKNTQTKRNKVTLYSLLGIFSAIFVAIFIILFIRKIYPWYLQKRNAEYGKLQIIYDKEKKV